MMDEVCSKVQIISKERREKERIVAVNLRNGANYFDLVN